MPKPLSRAQLRRLVVNRAYHCCEYCWGLARYSLHTFALEHIIPKKRKGKTIASNLALACQGCNGFKHTRIKARDPVTGKIVPLYHPRRHHWAEHFTWSDDYLEILGLTPTGRATVVALRLNRSEVVNLRRILVAFNEHPPTHLLASE